MTSETGAITNDLNEELKHEIDLEVDRAFIKKWMNQGEIQAMAEKHGLSKSSGYKILRGEWKNYEFLQDLYETAIERKQLFDRLHEKMQSI